MDRLLQFVLVLTFATSSYSYVYKRHEPEMPDTPPEFDLDDNYPKEYIRRLIDQLNPDELQKLRSLISLHHRAGAPSSSRCSTYSHKYIPHYAPDVFGTLHTIIQSDDYKVPKIEIDVEVCNYTKGNGCYTEEDDIHPTSASCCIPAKVMKTMPVVPVPKKEFESGNNYTSKEKYIEKDLYFDSRCECETIPLVRPYLKSKNNSDVCKLIFDNKTEV